MRLLADENFPRPIVDLLRKQGHDVLWARTHCPGLTDRVLLQRAVADDRLVLTLDKDFWQLALQRPSDLQNSGIILFRAHPAISQNLEVLVTVMTSVSRDWGGHVSIVTKDGVEMIPIRGPKA